MKYRPYIYVKSKNINMKFFYLDISRSSSEVSKVHMGDCPHIPPMINRSYLGPFNNAKEALRKARERKRNVAACPHCSEKELNSVAHFTSDGFDEHRRAKNLPETCI